jgi:hypothetical protein
MKDDIRFKKKNEKTNVQNTGNSGGKFIQEMIQRGLGFIKVDAFATADQRRGLSHRKKWKRI